LYRASPAPLVIDSDEGGERLEGRRRSGTELPQDAVVAGRYRVVRLLARGGMAEVYLARHVALNREVALKLLKPPPDAEDPEAFERRFELEAQTLASLDHRNVVILHDFGQTEDDRFFLAMEHVDGPRLTDLLRDGPLPYERAVGLMLQVGAAVRHAHRMGVIHRDLKPSNLLVKRGEDGEDCVKVVDFGLVKLTEGDQSLTRAGIILGSPHCMAPEQVKGLDVDHRVDIYAMGVLLFRSLTGEYPFHTATTTATMVAHLNQPVPSFDSVAPHVSLPAGLEPVVRRCLAKAPADRFATVDELMWELAEAAGLSPDQQGSLVMTQSVVQRVAVPPRRAHLAWGLAAAGAAAIGAAFVVALIGVLVFAGLWGDRELTSPEPVQAVASPQPPPEPPGTGAVEPPAAPLPVPEPERAPVTPPRRPSSVLPEVSSDAGRAAAAPPAPAPVVDQGTDALPVEPGTDSAPAAPEGYLGLPDDF